MIDEPAIPARIGANMAMSAFTSEATEKTNPFFAGQACASACEWLAVSSAMIRSTRREATQAIGT